MVSVSICVAVLGIALGSFVNALIWRLHEQEIESHKKQTAKRTTYLRELSITKGRSMCPHCHHQLAAIDLIPVISWLSLGGKCRYCRHPIEDSPIVEALTAILFVASYLLWPIAFHGAGLLEFICWLVFIVGFMGLAVYDLKWYLLPNRIVYPLLGLAGLQFVLLEAVFHGGIHLLLSSIWGILIGGGIFYAIFQLSKGKWIGGGDVKLGALLGFLVGGPLESCLMLFIASFLGTLVSLPLMISGKLKRDAIVPFGPFLLLATVFVRLLGASLIHWLKVRSIVP